MERDNILELLENTSVGNRLELVDQLYSDLETKQTSFCDHFAIHCKPGCGCCCEHFNPDVTDLEAEYIAYGLIKEGLQSEMLSLLEADKDGKSCPLYNWNSDFHCRIYKYRPLICRLFGASAVKDKNGVLQMRPCRWAPEMHVPSSAEMETDKGRVVNMSDFGVLLEEDEPGESQTYPISEAVPKALMKLNFLLELQGSQNPEK